ncbi:phospholipase D family protein [Aliiroseovarius sp. S2029]|uniref:phospholipase D family protein n=1 Tax=Aliiroseovarius sp. S2029 TaxID=2936988 RepID=UPI0020BF7558|nr:phospholipase D family protein [Aliiroseovarius sp. S2029]MCK8482916.1 phospholipase D family protein [Aliiroseovarius sp. S2029]
MRRFIVRAAKIVLVLGIAIIVARLVFPLPDISDRPVSRALPPDTSTALGARVSSAGAAHPGKSGVLPLQNGHDAIASRLALINAAEQSIDAQYYIWHDDVSGILMLDALHKAAQRGVRVRLLLDDNGVPGLDGFMAALNAQDNFQIRLFNPSTIRNPKHLGYSFDFFRMNRRMHNKSLIVDGSAAIIGGRNIGDEYFQVGDDNFYIDMDVLAVGAVVDDTTRVFDAYWNSPSVFGVETIIDGSGEIEAFSARVADVQGSDEAKVFQAQTDASAQRFAQGNAALEWTDVQLVADDPVKSQGVATRDQLMITRLGSIMGTVENRLDLVSAYFVPGREGTKWFTALSNDGKDVRILTNALNTTDVLMVHAGYTKYRTRLLQAGVELYELKLRGGGTQEAALQTMPFGLSGASLHAKTFALDQQRVFIGSFNFDPRSAILNCEMGFLIDSPTLARQVSAGFDGPVRDVSYQPDLAADGDLVWVEASENGQTILHDDEPGATLFQRMAIFVLGVLPIEWLL